MTTHYIFLQVMTCLYVVLTSGCAIERDTGAHSRQRSTITPTVQIQEVPIGNGKKYLKIDGWNIPQLEPSKRTNLAPQEHIINGRSITIDVTEYELTSEIFTEEPFDLIDYGLGLIRIRTVREYKINGKVFSYKIRANRVHKNHASNTQSNSGVLFFFTYYDEDGDGMFESLILDETNESGHSSFYTYPHVPQWALSESK